MPNPRAQRQVALNSAVDNLKQLAVPAQALGDMLASTLRGSVAATAGAPGDIRELIDLFGPEAVERVLGKRVMPTTEEMKGMMPKATSYEHPYESIGEFLPLPGTGSALKAAGYGLGRAAGAGTRAAGQAVSDAMIHQAGPLAKGPLSALAPRAAMTNVVKPKGGNWLAGSVEKTVEPLKSKVTTENFVNYTPEQVEQMVGSDRIKRNDAINQWIDRNLTNYIKKEMATPEDPIRKLAEEGVTHLPVGTPMPRNMSSVWTTREEAGFPAAMGTSREAQVWEALSDKPVGFGTAGEMINVGKGEPWMEKVDPFTKVNAIAPMESGNMARDLGFDHIIDVLKEDLVTGRIRPEQLNKISMEQAVRRTHEYDQELAKKMAQAKAAAREGLPVHKEYPEGYKWIQLDRPGAFAQESQAMGHSVRGYEPPIGHPDWIAGSGQEGDLGYGHGGWEAIKSGKAKVYSLVDPKGDPHVTIEVGPVYRDRGFRGDERPVGDDYYTLQQQYVDGQKNGTIDPRLTFAEWWRSTNGIEESETLPRISQIKGKGNAKPVEAYIPYVQDFVRSGNWADVGDFHNTDLAKLQENSDLAKWLSKKNIQLPKYPTKKELDAHEADFLLEQLGPEKFDEMGMGFLKGEGMATGGTPRPPTEAEREIMRKLRESFAPAATEAERQKRIQHNLEQMNKKVSFSDNPDTMMMELGDVHMAGGGLTKLAKLARAPAKTKEEIRAIAERVAPQVTGEYVRGKEGAKTVAGKTQKQFEREKTLEHDVRPTGAERPLPKDINIEDLKGNVMMGISGDPTITGHTVHGVAGRELKHPSPQHGGPLYGLGHDANSFWASNLGAARGVQNRARELGEAYEAPVIGNYVMMGPDSYSYAQHFADANLQNIRPELMTKSQIEGFNKMVREGYPYIDSKKVRRQRVFPSFPGIENPEEAYLHFAIDPDMRKHFGNLMQMPTVTEKFNLPSGLDVAHAVTEPSLRDLEIGVTGKSMGLMRPDIKDLKLSEHPTYSHDIPGEFMGGLKYPVPYELSFPDTLKSVRENPKQAPQEFGSFKMVGPRQTIDQQLIDEIKQYEEMMKALTGKKAGGEITAEDLEIEERPL